VSPFGLEPNIEALALQFWFPRLLGGIAGVALWALSSFFNGIGRTRITLWVMLSVALANALLNQLFIFHLHLGVAGSAWATGAAQLIGVAIGLAVFLSASVCDEFHAHTCWRPQWNMIQRTMRLGLPMGMLPAVDLVGLALFQAMQARTGTVGGAATQIVMMMTSIAYMPAIGIASAGTTLVGQSIGAGDRAWAARVGNAALKVTIAYMGVVSLVLALAGPWILPLFITPGDSSATQVVALGYLLLWIAAAYQIFDGFNLGSSFALRGAGDVRVPMLMILVLSWCGFIPLTHMLTFAPGQGLVNFLPQFGFGTVGGWSALLIYTFALGAAMFLRWRSGAWRKIVLR
jgi:MATE family multidrug resistance protein